MRKNGTALGSANMKTRSLLILYTRGVSSVGAAGVNRHGTTGF